MIKTIAIRSMMASLIVGAILFYWLGVYLSTNTVYIKIVPTTPSVLGEFLSNLYFGYDLSEFRLYFSSSRGFFERCLVIVKTGVYWFLSCALAFMFFIIGYAMAQLYRKIREN